MELEGFKLEGPITNLPKLNIFGEVFKTMMFHYGCDIKVPTLCYVCLRSDLN